nr:miraculin-like [Ipomoea batatas]
MKSITILFFSFLVFATFTNFVHCTLEPPEYPEQVLDTRGKPVRADTSYYIVPIMAGTGGGLTLRSTTRKFCPLGIFQEVKDDYPGIPISFYPVNPKKGVIRVSTDLNIDFPKNRVQCAKSNVWKVDSYDQYTKRFYIAIGGVKGNPGPKTINNWFKIEKYGRGYKLVHCPSVVQHKVMCKDVGVVKYNGQKRLALSDAPFGVMFKKA